MVIKGQRIVMIPEYIGNEEIETQIKALMENHKRNSNINWENVRRNMKKRVF